MVYQKEVTLGEPVKDRISRLSTRKAEIQGEIKSLRDNPNARNKEFKISRLEAQVTTITEKVKELRRSYGTSKRQL